MFGQHCIKSWSSAQAIIALSSGEAEYYGVVKAASVGLRCKSMYMDINIPIAVHVHTDAEAAKGIASRTGLGKTRHIAVHYLWVQERVRTGDICLKKVLGNDNPADLLTKHVDSNKIQKYMKTIGLEYRDGRSEATPTI